MIDLVCLIFYSTPDERKKYNKYEYEYVDDNLVIFFVRQVAFVISRGCEVAETADFSKNAPSPLFSSGSYAGNTAYSVAKLIQRRAGVIH